MVSCDPRYFSMWHAIWQAGFGLGPAFTLISAAGSTHTPGSEGCLSRVPCTKRRPTTRAGKSSRGARSLILFERYDHLLMLAAANLYDPINFFIGAKREVPQ